MPDLIEPVGGNTGQDTNTYAYTSTYTSTDTYTSYLQNPFGYDISIILSEPLRNVCGFMPEGCTPAEYKTDPYTNTDVPFGPPNPFETGGASNSYTGTPDIKAYTGTSSANAYTGNQSSNAYTGGHTNDPYSAPPVQELAPATPSYLTPPAPSASLPPLPTYSPEPYSPEPYSPEPYQDIKDLLPQIGPAPTVSSFATPTAPALTDAMQATNAPVTPSFDWATWTTQTTYFESLGYISQTTHLDTGSSVVNVVLNKVVLPWGNLLASVVEVPIDIMVQTDKALSNSRFGMEYHAFQTMAPLGKAMGIAMETPAAVQSLSAWVSATQKVQSIARTPAWAVEAARVTSAIGATSSALSLELEEGEQVLPALTSELNAPLANSFPSLGTLIPYERELPALVGESSFFIRPDIESNLGGLAYGSKGLTLEQLSNVWGSGVDPLVFSVSNFVQRARSAGFWIKVSEKWTPRQVEAAIEYRRVFNETLSPQRAGDAAHAVLDAAPRGADRMYFGVVAEIKTRIGVPNLSLIEDAMRQAEGYPESYERGAVVQIFDMLNGVKYLVQRMKPR
jgi:hypothetical protein